MEPIFLGGENIFKRFVLSNKDLIVVLNEDNEIQFVNNAFAKFFASTAEKFTGKKLIEWVPLDFKVLFTNCMKECTVNKAVKANFPILKNGNSCPFSHHLFRLDDGEILIQSSAERRPFPALNSKPSKEISNLVEIMNLGRIDLTKEGIINKVYPRMLGKLGYGQREIEGTSIGEQLLDRTGRLVIQRLLKQVSSGKNSKKEVSLRTKSGDKIRVLAYGIMEGNGQGHQNISLIFQDITKRKQNERDFRKAKSIAQREMNAERNFLATMSHEIRTPLNAILGMTELLYDTEPSKTQLKYLDSVSHAAQMLNNLLSDILDSAKLEDGKIELLEEDFSIEDTLDGIFQAFQFSSPTHVELVKNIESPNNLLRGDAKKISQVLMNLVGNAIKFTPQGQIEMGSKIIEETEESCLVRIYVKDSGIGIPESELENIFSRFKQVEGSIDRRYGGSGLGLYISSKIVALMDSELELQSEIGVGSEFSFTVYLEKTDKTKVSNQKDECELKDRDFSGLRILIAEDNELNQQFLKSLMAKFNIDYKIASNGIEAIMMSQKQLFDVILMDLQMPECDGFQASRTIRRAQNNPNRNTPIIACTASGLFNEQKEAYSAGMDNFLSKPFSQKKFLEVLVKHSNRKEDEKIDYLNFKLLFEMFDNDEEQIFNMVQVFLQKSESIQTELFESFDSKNSQSIYKATHKYKPSFGMVGIELVQRKLFEIEQITKQNKLNEKAMVLIESLRKDIPAAISQLKQTFNDESIRHPKLFDSRG
ncbi:MAG: ATP-binding protein [Bacteroidota bacterium]